MKTVLVTGARGFIGRNLVARLQQDAHCHLLTSDRRDASTDLEAKVRAADVIVHLAGVNRSADPAEFQIGNVDVIKRLLAAASVPTRHRHLVLASSIQAVLENAYGRSKRAAEEAAAFWAAETGGRVTVLRLKNVFGKWCRPNYNSVVATFCHNIARGIPVRIHDPTTVLDLVHVDDVCEAILGAIVAPTSSGWTDDMPSYRIALGELEQRLRAFDARSVTLQVPDMSARLNRLLYGTFVTYLEPSRWGYSLEKRADQRGDLAEFVKSPSFGQVFVSRTRPGVTRGNHFHHAKVEKFLVVAGSAVIRLRRADGTDVIDFPVRGEDYTVVEIPPGFTHSITNIGDSEMITLFWANEVFDAQRPDTVVLPVESVEAGVSCR